MHLPRANIKRSTHSTAPAFHTTEYAILGRAPALAAALILCAATSGCLDHRSPISTEQPSPLRAQVQPDESLMFGERFLVMPVEADGTDGAVWLASYQYSLKAGAWSGLSRGSVESYVNLRVVDLESRRSDAVFDRQVALGTLHLSRDERWRKHHAGRLLLVARATDSNQDKQIDQRDDAHVYIYDMAQRRLTQFTPAGRTAEAVVELGEVLTVIVRSTDGTYAICRGSPSKGPGEIVADSIAP